MRTMNITLPDADLNGDGTVTFDELVRSTLYIAAMIAMLLLSLVGGIALAFTHGAAWLRIVGGILALSAVLGSVIGIRRQIRYERAERLEREELARRRAREDYEFALLRGEAQTETDTRMNAGLQNQYAMLWLRWSYELDKPIPRDEWNRRGQPVDIWNRINRLMKERKIRRGSSLGFDLLEQAQVAWFEAENASRKWTRGSGGDFVKE